ncbi:MAG TPA: acylphosphatase [Propioniciclava sp.]|uniref:acylphosphatase n=1 Tax=Propioniciclava sp. TaxID=2038686 RepID=UPI002CFE3AC8|nr:acylphosphatase [Propioniciclava sp.]HRL49980.1 acylphosphatase [Propioniciclava sp.]HRL81286.1 acylphosphatase [Propioniciclava sp.]
MSDQAHVVVWVEGNVQGVGYRWWVTQHAEDLGLIGHARNLGDGRVEIEAQGPKAAVDELIALVTERRPRARRPGHLTGFLVEHRPLRRDSAGFHPW